MNDRDTAADRAVALEAPDPAGPLDLIDPTGLTERSRRRAAVTELAGELTAAATRANTRRAFDDDWRTWLLFCRASNGNVEPEEVSGEALVLYAAWLAADRHVGPDQVHTASAPATIQRRVTGVLAGWKARGHQPPRGIGADARKIITEYKTALIQAQLPTGRGKAPPLTVKDARRIAEACPDTLAGRRDLAVVLIGLAIAARRSELAHLHVADFASDDRGLLIDVRYAKTDPRRPAVLYGQNPETCPVRAWRHWQHTSGITTGPAFRRVDRHGNLGAGLSGEAIGNIVTRAGRRAGLEPRLTGHSVRAGLATEARRAGHDIATIAAQGGWKPNSTSLHEYIRIVDQWTDNALIGIGL